MIDIKKICTKCKEEKNISNFSLARKNVYRSRCNSCKNEDNRIYRLNNKEKDKQSKQNWEEKNLDYWKLYSIDNKGELKKYYSEYYKENKEEIINNVKKYYEKNKEDVLLERKKYYKKNKNSDFYKERSIKYYHIKKLNFPYIFAWRVVLKNALQRMNTKKTDRTINMLGYSATDLKNHMESLFQEGMNWNNWGEWHIHHKKFVSQFDKNTSPNIVNALDNLIPLWKEEHKIIHKNNE